MDVFQWHTGRSGGHDFHSQLKTAEHSGTQYPVLSKVLVGCVLEAAGHRHPTMVQRSQRTNASWPCGVKQDLLGDRFFNR